MLDDPSAGCMPSASDCWSSRSKNGSDNYAVPVEISLHVGYKALRITRVRTRQVVTLAVKCRMIMDARRHEADSGHSI